MSIETRITLAKGGENEYVCPVKDIIIPDLWHIAEVVRGGGGLINGPNAADNILECWHLAHDLKNHILQQKD